MCDDINLDGHQKLRWQKQREKNEEAIDDR
jgi:hypothetical protein